MNFDLHAPSRSMTLVLGACVVLWTGAAWAQLDPRTKLEDELFPACGDDPAVCQTWVRNLARAGVLDGDRDGVLDFQDACPGSPAPVARAERILREQDLALSDLRQLLTRTRELLIQGAGAISTGPIRRLLAGEIAGLFDELLGIANGQVDGRYLFSGLEQDTAPFAVSGSPAEGMLPEIAYRGDDGRLRLPIGRSGELVPVSIPGNDLFVGDSDADGRFPDAGRYDLFGLLAHVYDAFNDDDGRAIAAAIDATLAIQRGQLLDASVENSALYTAVHAALPSPELARVDPRGCSQAQFCSAIAIERFRDARACEQADFLNDEPLLRSPRDCRVHRVRGEAPACAAREEPAGRGASRRR